jgi:V/A-type H+/Na+-transporting ATPase subunit D
MAKIKYTKTELKAQRDALRRFERYLPTLQLKKQQLQMEVRQLEIKIEAKAKEEQEARAHLEGWVKLYAEPHPVERYLRIQRVHRTTNNIAGVNVPVLEHVSFDRDVPDLFQTAPWLDDGLDMLEKLAHLRVERLIIEEQHRLLQQELRVTTQRVNLFEKVKIPETREHIRVIRIFIGDQQTAEVARAKMAKDRAVKAEAEAAA